MPDRSHHHSDAIARAYARAWFELAQQHGQLDETDEEARQLAEVLRDSGALRNLLSNPAIDTAERDEMLQRLFDARVSDLTLKFLRVVNRNHRAGRLDGILHTFIALVDDHRGIVTATATVADELPQDRLDAIAGALGKSLGDKTVRLAQRVDPAVIGGLRLRIGDQLLDASVATQLRIVEQRLKQQGREKAREVAAGVEGPRGQVIE
jgi:F-type H+-transporting ATPase subunit delta